MDGFEFVTSLIGSLARPIAVATCAFIFRDQIRVLLRRLNPVEFAGGKAILANLSSVEATVAPGAGDGADDPGAAVVEENVP